MRAHKSKSRISASVFESAKALHDSQMIDDDKLDEFKELCLMPAGIPRDFLSGFIKYCEKTGKDEWCVDVVSTKDENKSCPTYSHCLFGHLCDYAGDDLKLREIYWDHFENYYATTYMVYPVNDGEHPNYQQSTPKQRCLAYLKDHLAGKAKTTHDVMREDAQRMIE